MGDLEKTTSNVSSESSIDAPNNGTEQGHDDIEEVMSKESNVNGGLASLGSMLDTLPTQRRGLSECYNGKGKSLADLSEAITVKDLEKKEHPLNQWMASVKARKMHERSMAQIVSTDVQCEGHQQELPKEAEQNLHYFKP